MKFRIRAALLCLLGLLCMVQVAYSQEIPDDPGDRFEAIQAKRLGRHPYFSKVSFERCSPKEGYVFFVQKSTETTQETASQAAKQILPWFEKLESLFVERYVTPNKLVNTRGGAPHVIYLLTSSGDYDNYIRYSTDPCATCQAAVYDPYLSVLVTYQQLFGRTLQVGEKPTNLLHAFTHSLQQSYGFGKDRLPGPEWFVEGQAIYLSMTPGLKLEEVGTPYMDPRVLRYVVKAQQAGGLKGHSLRPLEELVAIDSRRQFRDARGGNPKDYWRDMHTLAAQSGLFIKYLNEANDGEHRKALADYTKLAITGRGAGTNAVVSAFGNLAELEDRFWQYLFAEQKKIDPSFVAKSPSTTNQPAAATPAESMPTFSVSDLMLGNSDMEARLGLAMWRARQGKLEEAITQLESLSIRAASERAQSELARVTGLRDLRDAYLLHLVETGSKLRIDHEGKKLLAVIDRVDEGVVHLKKNRRGVEALHLEQISLVDLCEQMSREKPKFGEPLIHAYASVLAGDERWIKQLRRIDEDQGLEQAATEHLPPLFKLGSIASSLEALAATSVDELDAPTAQSIIDQIAAVLATGTDQPLVEARKDTLRGLASSAFRRVLASQPLEDLLEGQVERLSDDRVRISYDFDDPSQLNDFSVEPNYMNGFRKGMPDLTEAQNAGLYRVADGRLELLGKVGLRLPVTFDSPQQVKYIFRVGTDVPSPQDFYYCLLVALCGDRKGNGVKNFNFGHLYAFDAASRYSVETPSPLNAMFFGTYYGFELNHDGSKLTCVLDGKELTSVACGARDRGEVFIFVHSQLLIEISDFSVEGRLSPGATDALRDRSAANQVNKLFGE